MNPSINSKLKAMYAEKLNREDLEDLMKQQNLTDAIYLLKNKVKEIENLPIDAKRLEIEESLDKILISDILKISKYVTSKNQDIWRIYLLKFKIKLIKELWNNINSNEDIDIQLWTSLLFTDLKGLDQVKNKDDFIVKIHNNDIKQILQKDITIFERENNLDKMFFEKFAKISKESNNKVFEIIQKEIDLNNIVWTYRMAQYKNYNYKEFIVSKYCSISDEVFKNIQDSKNINALKIALSVTKYKNVITSNIEIDIKKYLYKIYERIFKTEMLDFSLVIAYFKLLELQRENIITILEGIRYKLDIKEIQKRIIY